MQRSGANCNGYLEIHKWIYAQALGAQLNCSKPALPVARPAKIWPITAIIAMRPLFSSLERMSSE